MTKTDWYRVLQKELEAEAGDCGFQGICRGLRQSLETRLVFSDWLADQGLEDEAAFQQTLHALLVAPCLSRQTSHEGKDRWIWYQTTGEDPSRARRWRDQVDLRRLGLSVEQIWPSMQAAEAAVFEPWSKLDGKSQKLVFWETLQ
jgi:hypothetical protein